MGLFRMPSLGADMEAANLVEWHIGVGDTVERGDIVADVETDKGTIEVECFETGSVDALYAEPGERIPVGAPMAWLRAEDDPPAPSKEELEGEEKGPASPEEAQAPAPTPPQPPPARRPVREAAGPGKRVRAVPAARKLASEKGIDLNTVTPSGADGIITREDVEQAAAPAPSTGEPTTPPKPAPDTGAAMRRAIAVAMSRSNRDIPHYYLTQTVDMEPALQWLAKINEERPVSSRILPAALLYKAVARAVRSVEALNGFWLDDGFQPQPSIHLGIAVSLRTGGLVTPALHDADGQSLDELMRNISDVIRRARAGSLRSSELTDTTITVTSLGDQGAESVFGVIYPPQVALVGLGAIVPRPWAVGDQVEVRRVMAASLAADHRASDGVTGSRFLQTLARILADPDALLEGDSS